MSSASSMPSKTLMSLAPLARSSGLALGSPPLAPSCPESAAFRLLASSLERRLRSTALIAAMLMRGLGIRTQQVKQAMRREEEPHTQLRRARCEEREV